MAPRMESRNMMVASLEERDEMESPMARRERHRRFLENRRRKAARSEDLEARTDDDKDKPKTAGFDTPSDDTPSEDDKKTTTTTNPPPPTATPVAQTTPTVETKTTKSLVDAPTNAPPRKGSEPPATSPPPPPGPPSPTSTPPPPPPSTTSTTSRSLFVNTPITHAPFEKSSTTATSEAPKATASTTPPVALPLLASSSQSISSVLRGSPSSTFATSTSLAAITSAKITSSAVVEVPEATSAPAQTSSTNANTRAGNGKQAGESSSISSVLPTTAVADSRPTAGLGVADQKGLTATAKDTNTRTIGIVTGVLVGSLALIFLAWLLIGRKAKQLRKRRDEFHEKEAQEPTFAANRRGSSVAESRIWNASSVVAPTVAAPSEAGFPGGFPAALPTYPAYDATKKSFPESTYSHPSQLPSPLKVNGLEAHRDVMEFGNAPDPARAPSPEAEDKKSSWRDSVATMSTIVSVARFRTVKSWAWDQRKRNMADSNIPDLPTMPNTAPYKQLD